MTIQHLQYILEVQRTGSVSRAAKNLFVSQSGISTSIASLEAELGFPVFERTRHGMVATQQGLRVLEHAGKICASYSELLHTGAPAKKQIRIGCGNFAPISNAFTKLIVENKDREDLQFFMVCNIGVDAIIDRVACRALELGVLMTHTPAVESRVIQIRRRGLQAQLLKPVPTVITIGPGHRLYEKQNISPQDFADEAIVDLPACATVNNRFLQSMLPINREKAILVSSRYVRSELIRQGVAYSIGPLKPGANTSSVLRHIPLGNVTSTPIVITDPTRPMSAEIARYLELLRQEMAR